MGEEIKPHIWTDNNGRKHLSFRVSPNKNGADKYGKTHNVSIRYKAVDGNYYTQYIGKGVEKAFGQGGGNNPLPAPAPRQSAPAQGASTGAAALAAQKATATPAPAPSNEADSDLPF